MLSTGHKSLVTGHRSLVTAKALEGAGALAYLQGDYATARSLYEECLPIRRELGDKQGIATLLNNLGLVAQEHGDYPTTRTLYEESLAIRRELGDKRGIAISLNNLGLVAYNQEDYAAARYLHDESLAISRELGHKWGIAVCLAGLGGIAAGMGHAEHGARLLGASDALLHAVGTVLEEAVRMPYEQGILSARAKLSEEEFEQAWAEGQAMSMEEAIEYALGGGES